jgi:hypothetical protein
MLQTDERKSAVSSFAHSDIRVKSNPVDKCPNCQGLYLVPRVGYVVCVSSGFILNTKYQLLDTNYELL